MFKILLKKESVSLFSSAYFIVFALLFLLISGLFLWILPGSYNILDNGYATLDKYFTFSSILMIILIPALTMRSFSEEKSTGTLDLQLSRPISLSQLYLSKCAAILLFLLILILSSLIYLYTVYRLGNPVGNIDLGVVFISYIGLIVVASIFVFWGVLASSFSKFGILGFIVALFFNFLFYYGFDLLGSLFSNITIRNVFHYLSLNTHFDNLRRGVLSVNDIAVLLGYFLLAWSIVLLILGKSRKNGKKKSLGLLLLVVLISVVGANVRMQIDFTQDKRYTLNDATKLVLFEVGKETEPIEINLYLSQDINYSFEQLRKAVVALIADFNKEAKGNIHLIFKDPTAMSIPVQQVPSYMADRLMPPIILNEKSRDGKITQQLIYPYAEVIYKSDTLQVSLLKQLQGYGAEQNLNASIESLEFEFIDAINLLVNRDEQHIAFIEGHDELSRVYLYNAEEDLSKYFFVNRGEIGSDLSVLDNFKAIVIAGPKEKFNETEKYILDQYLMKGGRILWLIDGAKVSDADLREKGHSASVKNETNLDDLLFSYGVRINADLLQDGFCSEILLNNGDNSQAISAPWYYAPILIPSLKNPITANISDVKSEFVSSIDVLKNKNHLKKEILLTTGQSSRKIDLPAVVDFDIQSVEKDKFKFNDSFMPVAISLEGTFGSAFKNRLIPDGLYADYEYKTIEESKPTKMIVVAGSDIIKNGLMGKDEDTQIIPLGFDRLSGRTYGNRDFILNAVNWLVSDDKWMSLRSKEYRLSLLDKRLVSEKRDMYSYVNLFFPILVVIFVWLFVFLRRRHKYAK